MLVDSHCHLDMLDLSLFDNDMDNVIQAAQDHGVAYMLCIAVNMEDFPNVLNIADNYVNVFASVGVHPADKDVYEPTVDELIQHAKHPFIVAIGETGLDYYHCKGDLKWQHDRFRKHIEVSKALNKPLIIHSRDAAADTIKILKASGLPAPEGVFHCFTYDWEVAKKALDIGFYISFSGIVTFKNAKALQEVAKKVPLDRMLIETDAPYLAPVPFRGKPNQPAYVRYVADCIANLRGISLEEVAEQTTKNFFALFKHANKK